MCYINDSLLNTKALCLAREILRIAWEGDSSNIGSSVHAGDLKHGTWEKRAHCIELTTTKLERYSCWKLQMRMKIMCKLRVNAYEISKAYEIYKHFPMSHLWKLEVSFEKVSYF